MSRTFVRPRSFDHSGRILAQAYVVLDFVQAYGAEVADEFTHRHVTWPHTGAATSPPTFMRAEQHAYVDSALQRLDAGAGAT